MVSDDPSQSSQDHRVGTSPYSAANPYMQSSMGTTGFGYGGSQPYSSYTPYQSYGFGSQMGFGGYGQSPMMGDNMWEGFIGETAKTLGRLNNFLTMTGMLVDHVSNHSKLLYSKGVEFHGWYTGVREWGNQQTEWMERLGLQIEAGWRTNESEEVRRRRMMIRRVRTILIMGFFVLLTLLIARRRTTKRTRALENIYSSSYRS
jgi:hypothetical protein